MRTKSGRAFTLYLNPEVKELGSRFAAERYGIALSKLVERLLKKEMSRKRGIVHETASLGVSKGSRQLRTTA